MTCLCVGSFQAPNGERWRKLLPGQLSESVLERLKRLWGQRGCFVDLQSLKIVKRGNESYLLYPSGAADGDCIRHEFRLQAVDGDRQPLHGSRQTILGHLRQYSLKHGITV